MDADGIIGYLQIGGGEFLFALVLAFFIFLSLYFSYRLYEANRKIRRLRMLLHEAELDRASLLADTAQQSAPVVDRENIFDVERGVNNTLLQHELENYLLREQEKNAAAKQNFINISSDFIDFLKVKAGKIELTETFFMLDELLDGLAKRLRSQLVRMQVELIFDIEKTVPPKLRGDKKHIQLLLFYLLSNILHHRAPSQLLLHVKSSKEPYGRLRVFMSVEGCSLGSELDDPALLFQPFSDTALDEHMRIELYIARELSRMMGGDVKVSKNGDGRGLCSIELLIAESHPDEKRFYHLPSRNMLGSRILIVEENARLAESLKAMYAYFKNEVTVIASTDLSNAPEQIKNYQTVVIEKSYLQLPLIERFRSIKKGQKVNVVVLISAKEELDYTFPVGAVDQLLVKPVTIQRVFDSIILLEERNELPSVSRAMERSAKAELKGEFSKKIFEDFAGKRIFVIENDDTNRKALLSLFGKSGVNLSLAVNTQESLWMLEKFATFDLILLSARIDTESNVRLTRKIRHMNRYKGVPIILMGNKERHADVSGVDEILAAPVQAGSLYALLNYYLDIGEPAVQKRSGARPVIAFVNTFSLAARDGYEMASFDEKLYTDILREFAELYSDSDTKMNQVLVQDDLEALQQLCLDVKGVAANIGAYNLANIAGQIHATISKGMARNLMGLIQQYQPELKRVTDQIAAYLKA